LACRKADRRQCPQVAGYCQTQPSAERPLCVVFLTLELESPNWLNHRQSSAAIAVAGGCRMGAKVEVQRFLAPGEGKSNEFGAKPFEAGWRMLDMP
jgi:hypothetical protein